MIIDFHTHTFPDKIAAGAVAKLAQASRTQPFTDGTVAQLAASMQQSCIDYSVNLPVITAPEQTEKINTALIRQLEVLNGFGILTFGGMHPDHPDCKKELRRLKREGIKGIKIHPAYQGIDFNDIRMKRLVAHASAEDLIVIIHAGIDIGLYDHDYASVAHILEVIKDVAPTKLVLAHMGGWATWNDVESDLAGAPVWLDTSFSIGPVTPLPDVGDKPPYQAYNLSDEDFVRIVRKHGTDRILFATDSPWEDQADYIGRIDRMPLSAEEKQKLFGANAEKLLFER